MPITDCHPQYKKHRKHWQLARDVLDGVSALKCEERREEYLPKLAGHIKRPHLYNTYVENAHYFNASGRTHAGLRGLIERKPPDVEAPDSMGEFLSNVTGNGTTIDEFAFNCASENLCVGRGGIFVDYSESDGVSRSNNEARAAGLRPFWTFYEAESITDWWEARIGGEEVVVKIRLREKYRVGDPNDEFFSSEKCRYRVLDLEPTQDEESGRFYYGRYRQRFFYPRKKEKSNSSPADDEFEYIENEEERVYPVMNSEPMYFIPFGFLNPGSTLSKVEKPPLLDLFTTNIAHYRNSASFENGLLLSGSPTPWVNNYDPSREDVGPDGKLTANSEGKWLMGGGNVWTFIGACQVGLLSISKDSLGALESALEEKSRQMVVLGARVIESEQRPAESGVAKEIDDDRDSSMLATISITTSKALTKALEWTRDWMIPNSKDEVSVTLNTDFFGRPLTPAEATAVADLWLKYGIYAKSDARRLLRRGEWIGQERTDEMIEEELSLEDPTVTPDVPDVAAAPNSTEEAILAE